VVSRHLPDLVHWDEQPVALLPDEGYAVNGVFSGAVYMEPEGRLSLYYTCADADDIELQGEAKFVLEKDQLLRRWHKSVANPVIRAMPEGGTHMQFRDPFLWDDDDGTHMALAVEVDEEGAIVRYDRDAATCEWVYGGQLWNSVTAEHVSARAPMVECPGMVMARDVDGTQQGWFLKYSCMDSTAASSQRTPRCPPDYRWTTALRRTTPAHSSATSPMDRLWCGGGSPRKMATGDRR